MSCPPATTRITIFAKRRAGLTSEEFHTHWSDVHAPLIAPWLLKYGVVAYSQVHWDAKDDSAEEYDGIAQFDVSDTTVFKEAFADPYYTDVIKPDEASFMVTSPEPKQTGGALKVFIEGGKPVESVTGQEKKFEEFEKKTAA